MKVNNVVLEIADSLVDNIRRHGARAYPNECCGALLGNGEPGEADKKVEALLSLDNRSEGEAARTRFFLTADDFRTAEKAAQEKGLILLGFYHSHPDHPARPSDFDREHALPWYSYIIVSVAHGEPQEATCWVLTDDRSRFLSEPMRAPAASNS